jgi:LysM repeat protein
VTGGRGGLLFDEGPTACPFVALDRDRERRADEPDTRHRCYATPTPEPRALAHQRNFCLTANFSACPIFQDWAIRSAARPVPMRPIPPALALTDDSRPVGEPEFSPPAEPAVESEDGPEQVGLFDEQASKPPALAAAPPMPTFRLTAPLEEQAPGENIVAAPPAIIPPPARPAALATPSSSALSAPVSSAPASAPPAQPKPTPSKPIKPPKSPLKKEDIVPAWERSYYDVPDPGRSSRRSGGRDVFSLLTVVFSVLAVVTLVALGVILLPALFGRPGSATPTPTLAAGASATAAGFSPTAQPTPQSTWQTYTIQLGDSLYGIAGKFNITYDQLLAANPQITNPDFIVVGQVVNIPPPSYAAPSPSAAATATPTPTPTVTPKPTKKR